MQVFASRADEIRGGRADLDCTEGATASEAQRTPIEPEKALPLEGQGREKGCRQMRQHQGTPMSRPVSRKCVSFVGMIGLLALLSGCAREVATTTIKPDGSWTRQVAIHTPKPDMNAPGGAPPLGEAVKPEDVFVLPTAPTWKITKSEKDSDAIYTAERTLALGESVSGDISVKRDKDKSIALVNQVTVKQMAPGTFVYTETFSWKGPKPKELTAPDPDMLAAIKGALPAKLATDANTKALSLQIAQVYWRIMFGPGAPLVSRMSQVLMEP